LIICNCEKLMPITQLELEQLVSSDGKELRCSGKKLTKKDLKLICSFLDSHKSIKSLYVFWNNIDDEGAKILAENKTLTSLYIGSNEIGNGGIKALAQNKAFTLLDVTNNRFDNEGTKSLAQSETLVSLNVAGNKINKEGIKALAQNKSLTSLELGNCVDKESAKILAANTTLTSLVLPGSPIGIGGLEALAENKTLTFLNVGGPKFGDQGAEILAKNTTLRALHIDSSNLSPKGAKALAQNATLTSLSVSENEIGSQGAKFLAENKTLTHLYVSFNQIGDEGAIALAKNKNLTCLNVRGNQISEVGAKALAKNEFLKSLDIAENLIREEGGKALAENKTLTSLDVGMTKMGGEAGKAIANNTFLKTLYIHSEDVDSNTVNALINSNSLNLLYVDGHKIINRIEMLTKAQDDFRNSEHKDSRLFNTWYANLDVQRIVWFIYQNELAKKASALSQTELHPDQNPYLDPFVFFDGLDAIPFDSVMAFCKEQLIQSSKNYFPIIFKPELGSAHYMAAILRKEPDGSVTFFLFNPLGYSDEETKKRAKRRLNIPDTAEEVGGMKLIMSPHQIQSSVKDGGPLVSCGPITIEFIKHALQHPEWIDNLDEQFNLPAYLEQYKNDSQEHYKQRLEAVRSEHDQLLGKMPNEILESIEDFYAPLAQHFLNTVVPPKPTSSEEYSSDEEYSYGEDPDGKEFYNTDGEIEYSTPPDANSEKPSASKSVKQDDPIPESRQNLVEHLKKQLNSYQQQRNERFYIKDKLDPRDQKKRAELIRELSEELDVFIASGDSKNLIQKITEQFDNYPGIYLKTTLSQIALSLIQPTPADDYSEKAKTILEQHQEAQSIYVIKIKELYQKIEILEEYACKLKNAKEIQAVNTLASELKKDMDYFVSQHDKSLPDKDSFNHFKTKFKFRLHSQDVLMSKREKWYALALNILVGVVSLGIVLGVKAIHSKRKYGELEFFAEKSNKRLKLEKIEKRLEQLEFPDPPKK
jgi:hypothetical protein